MNTGEKNNFDQTEKTHSQKKMKSSLVPVGSVSVEDLK